MLNLKCHHSKLSPVICVTHSFHKNGLSGLGSYFSYVVLTGAKTNVKSLASVLSENRFDQDSRRGIVERFLTGGKKRQYFVIDLLRRATFWCSKENILRVRPRSEGVEAEEEEEEEEEEEPDAKDVATSDALALERAGRYLSLLPEWEISMALFELILPILPSAHTNLGDLSVRVETRARSKSTLSLVDYLFAVTTPGVVPRKMEMTFHRYVAKKVALPRLFLKNKAFRSS